MNNLRSFVALQARLYEFLEQQDEATLQGIASGTVQLSVLPALHPASTDLTTPPSSDPFQAAQDFPKLPSEHERRVYLNATGLNVKQLQRVAKLLGLKRYSNLSKPKLIDLLASHVPNQTDALAGEPARPAPASPGPVDNSADEKQVATAESQPSPVALSTDTAKSRADAAAIASRLREIETEEEGATYLRTQRLDRVSLLAVAAELQLTRVDRLKQSELEKRVLKQAIGARRKFAGLRKW